MDNKDLYKKALDEIHVPEDLKNKTLNRINNKTSKFVYMKYLAACAIFVVAITFGIYYVSENNNPTNINSLNDFYAINKDENLIINSQANDLPTFKDMDELRNVLKENAQTYNRSTTKDAMTIDSVAQGEIATSGEQSSAVTQNFKKDYSNTNVQVEGVDEADIIKTDGRYIYYVMYNVLHIIDANTLEEVSRLDYRDDDYLNKSFISKEIYLVNNRLVVLGDYYTYETTEKRSANYEIEDSVTIGISHSGNYAKAMIYDISNPRQIKLEREVKIDGAYTNSRMIGNNLYFISTKTPIYYDEVKDLDLLPSYQVNNEEKVYLPANRIVYFPNTNNYNYVIIAGVDISKESEVNIASFFGAWTDKIYASENNLYIPIVEYLHDNEKNEIYKFSLNNSKVEYVAKGKFEGYLDSQFSIDEYNNFLRIATTSGYDENATNTLYILNSNLEEVSKLTNIAKGEKIYSVRFMGKVGYIVTFEQIDPLFVIDLSDPYNPKIKGELEMPGYSSYLHPYDETHIIGIGYNVKSNGYGGVTNANMKMAMFDVSDLNNPKEMFNVSIGDGHVYSELNNNHKALFFSKTKNLIGFPIQTWNSTYYRSKSNFTLYDIDLEKGFIVHGKIEQDQDYGTDIKRAIYIEDSLYTIAENKITKYDLNSFEKINELEI